MHRPGLPGKWSEEAQVLLLLPLRDVLVEPFPLGMLTPAVHAVHGGPQGFGGQRVRFEDPDGVQQVSRNRP